MTKIFHTFPRETQSKHEQKYPQTAQIIQYLAPQLGEKGNEHLSFLEKEIDLISKEFFKENQLSGAPYTPKEYSWNDKKLNQLG